MLKNGVFLPFFGIYARKIIEMCQRMIRYFN